jgi:hypothetical protein
MGAEKPHNEELHNFCPEVNTRSFGYQQISSQQ